MTRTRIGLVPGLLLALALALPIGACGGNGGNSNEGVASLDGDKATTTTRAGGSGDRQTALNNDRQAALNWARCMRQHGINLPDPQFSGDDIGQQLPVRAVRESAKFKAAEQACKQYLPNGGQPTPPSAQERQQALAFARCVRQHGINMPDPKVTADGIDEQLPPGMRKDDPRLKAAWRACEQRGGDGK